MSKVAQRYCETCKDPILPTDRRWDHVSNGGLRVESYCEGCMLAEVNDYAERTIMGMLDGQVEVLINGEAIKVVGARVVGSQAVKPEGTEP